MASEPKADFPSKETLLNILSTVKDPEIPVLSVIDMGIIRDVRISPHGTVGWEVEVDITPTYSGCPAMKVIEDEVRAALIQAGCAAVKVRLVYSPAWTTDWMGEDAKERLRAYGIAPPKAGDGLVRISPRKALTCPYCGSTETEIRSEFGSTACKALYFCKGCVQPFEYFKSV